MAEHLVSLRDGITIGDDCHREVALRELTAADIFAAQEAAERLVFSPDNDGRMQPALVVSDSKFGVELLRRQVARIGEISKITTDVLGRLSTHDLALLQEEAATLEAAGSRAIQEMAERGRV